LFTYTAITLSNPTTATIGYKFMWPNGTWTNYTLTAGQRRVHYINGLNQAATIAFDKSFSAGYQEQRYSLTGRNVTRAAGLYLVEPVPTVAEGRLYTFQRVTNGVQLYS
jgi:hypothetical protein